MSWRKGQRIFAPIGTKERQVATHKEKLADFMSDRPGTVFTIDEIANGSNVPRNQVSYYLSMARKDGMPIANPSSGRWAWVGQTPAHTHHANGTVTLDPEPDGQEPEPEPEPDGQEPETETETDGQEPDSCSYDLAAQHDHLAKVLADMVGQSEPPDYMTQLQLVLSDALRRNSGVVLAIQVGHDRDGNRIVTSPEGCAYRLVEL